MGYDTTLHSSEVNLHLLQHGEPHDHNIEQKKPAKRVHVASREPVILWFLIWVLVTWVFLICENVLRHTLIMCALPYLYIMLQQEVQKYAYRKLAKEQKVLEKSFCLTFHPLPPPSSITSGEEREGTIATHIQDTPFPPFQALPWSLCLDWHDLKGDSKHFSFHGPGQRTFSADPGSPPVDILSLSWGEETGSPDCL